ncbi:MAG: hypothetical protein ACR2J8_06680, partial [Thermomicrobiales bacterium]
ARCNAVHYAMNLRDVIGLQEWSIPLPDGWTATGAALAMDSDGTMLALCSTGGAQIAIVRLDRDGQPMELPILLDDRTIESAADDDHPSGLEDLRLFQVGGQWAVSGAAQRLSEPHGMRTVCTGLFDLDLAAATIGNVRWLPPMSASEERTWSPAALGDDLWFVGSYGPTVALSADTGSGEVSLAASEAAPRIADGWCAGTPLLPLADRSGWIALVREIARWPNGSETVLHRVVRFGADWTLTHLSHPFRFRQENRERAAGIMRRGGEVLVVYSVAGERCWMAAMAESALLNLLLPVESFGGREVVAAQRVWLAEGHRQVAIGAWEAAHAAYARLAASEGNDALAAEAALRAAHIAGKELGRWDDALALCLLGVSRDPHSVAATSAAAQCALMLGNYSRAVGWARVAIAIETGSDAIVASSPASFSEPHPQWDDPWSTLEAALRADAEDANPAGAAAAVRRFGIPAARKTWPALPTARELQALTGSAQIASGAV